MMLQTTTVRIVAPRVGGAVASQRRRGSTKGARRGWAGSAAGGEGRRRRCDAEAGSLSPEDQLFLFYFFLLYSCSYLFGTLFIPILATYSEHTMALIMTSIVSSYSRISFFFIS